MQDDHRIASIAWSRRKQADWLKAEGEAFDPDPGRRFSIYLLRRVADRIFFNAPAGVLLKGGLAGRFRTLDARFTTDIDLHSIDKELAIDHVLRSMLLDLDDGIGFLDPQVIQGPPGVSRQTSKAIATISLEPYWGTRLERNRIKIQIAQEPAVRTAEAPRPGLLIPPSGLPVGEIALYPLVFQVAQKVCGCLEMKNGHPSSRSKDLVDLCVIALTERINRRELILALASEFAIRGMAWPDRFAAPESMRSSYGQVAMRSKSVRLPRTFDQATELASKFLLLEQLNPENLTWDPEELIWR